MTSEDKLLPLIFDLEHKQDSALLTLAFSALALSVQFSPKMGHEFAWLLVASWVCLLLSGFFGGWRLVHKPVAIKLNLRRNEYKEDLQRWLDPNYQASLAAGRVLDPSGKPLTKEMQATLEKERRGAITQSEAEMKAYNGKFVARARVQIWLLAGGLLANGVFSAINYLSEGGTLR